MAYSRAELYDLWTGFKDQHDATRIMMDFALCDKAEAKELIAEFQVMYEARILDIEHRGKESREKSF